MIMEELLYSFQNRSALVINTDIMIQAASSRRLHLADMTASEWQEAAAWTPGEEGESEGHEGSAG